MKRPPYADRFWAKVEKSERCWTWIGQRRRDGYGSFSIDSRHYAAHRLSWEMENGPIPDGKWVLHRCDNRPCVRPTHLYIGDRTQNTSDAMLRHRFKAGDEAHFRAHPEVVPRGESHWASRLTDDVVRLVRQRAAIGERQSVIATELGISQSAVSLIVTRKRWAHVTD